MTLHDGGNGPEYHMGYKDGFAAGLKTNAHKWISVKDRLPEDHQKVLCFNGKVLPATFNERPGEGICSLWESKYTKQPTDWGLYDVTHWMPLPEPPHET